MTFYFQLNFITSLKYRFLHFAEKERKDDLVEIRQMCSLTYLSAKSKNILFCNHVAQIKTMLVIQFTVVLLLLGAGKHVVGIKSLLVSLYSRVQ